MARPVQLTVVPVVPEVPVPTPADAPTVLEVAAAQAKRGMRGAMATVLARTGSAPSTPGQKIYVAMDGSCVGTVGGGAVEREVIDALARIAGNEAGKHEVRTFRLGPELAMC